MVTIVTNLYTDVKMHKCVLDISLDAINKKVNQ
jgi:hypothetical protein